jgi:hypothetical protein
MKNLVKYILQKVLGLKTYMSVFARFKIKTLHRDKKENDFFHFMGLLSDGKGAILDIGANLGVMSTHLARKFPHSTIHSFEPLPINYTVFQKLQKKKLACLFCRHHQKTEYHQSATYLSFDNIP